MVRLQGSEGAGATLTIKPRSCRHSTITWVSSLQSAPEITDSPSANAASTSARFVMLFEPGTAMDARTGSVSGTISMHSGIGMIAAHLPYSGELLDPHHWSRRCLAW